jgi:hypothetical protein
MMRKSPERWIILETLTADDYSIKFEGGGATDASIAVGILKVLFPKFKFGTENEFKGELKFAGEPHIVAVKAVRIKDAVKFAGSGELPEVVNPLEYYKVVDSRQ